MQYHLVLRLGFVGVLTIFYQLSHRIETESINTFTGPATVSQGQLILNGSLAGNVTVGTGGIVGGSGTIGGSLTANGGIVSPGNSPGILTVGGNYTEAGTVDLELAGTGGVHARGARGERDAVARSGVAEPPGRHRLPQRRRSGGDHRC
jgi:uncharacterized protein with beta-barrel porin domain